MIVEDVDEDREHESDKNDNDSMEAASSSNFSHSVDRESMVEKERDKIIRMIEQNFKSGDKIFEGGGSSVGSSLNNQFAYRDTLKKIRLSIKSKSAPMNLKISMSVIAVSLLICIGIDILTKSLSDTQTKNTIDFLWDSKNITEILISYNKLTTYMEFSRMQNSLSATGSYEAIYEPAMTSKINIDVNNTLDRLMTTLDFMSAKAMKSKEVTPLQNFFFFDYRTLRIKGTQLTMPIMTFMDKSINILYSFIKNGFGNSAGTSSKALDILGAEAITNNENVILSFNLDYFSRSLSIGQDMTRTNLLISVADMIARGLLVMVALLISLPMLYVSMEKSNEILQIISKITMYNIQFYNNHYNKLISLLNNDSNQLEGTVEKVAEAYKIGMREKERKEKQNLVKLRMKGSRDYKKKKTFWVVSGLLILIGILIVQCGKAILTTVSDLAFAQSVEAVVKIPITANAYSAINMLGFKLLYYPMLGLPKDDQYKESFSLINRFFTETVKSKETIGESRLQIKDSTFEAVFNQLFSSDLCKTIFGN